MLDHLEQQRDVGSVFHDELGREIEQVHDLRVVGREIQIIGRGHGPHGVDQARVDVDPAVVLELPVPEQHPRHVALPGTDLEHAVAR